MLFVGFVWLFCGPPGLYMHVYLSVLSARVPLSYDVTTSLLPINDVPGDLVGYPRAYLNQFPEFNSHRVHILLGTFLAFKN